MNDRKAPLSRKSIWFKTDKNLLKNILELNFSKHCQYSHNKQYSIKSLWMHSDTVQQIHLSDDQTALIFRTNQLKRGYWSHCK